MRENRREQRRNGGRGAPGSGRKLGTFIGVFTPSILTILGVILYLRTGWVVGNAGILGAVVIVVIANGVTFLTALSVAAVATNMRVGAGGAYFMISRSLGVEIGAAIGIPLFLAQAFSVTLYAFGLAESLQLIWPGVPLRPVAILTILAVALLATRGAGLALKLQLPIMGGILLSLLALAFGVVTSGGAEGAVAAAPEGVIGFWEVFAVFFPAVTGIMAGVSLSGDLEEPAKSIPWGTLVAVLVGFVVYLVVVLALGTAADRQTLIDDNLIWFTLAGGVSFLIFPGIWGAIFSSAVGSVLSAPRTLQAMVDDRVLPDVFGRSIGRIQGPGVPLLIALAVALGAVGLGDLNAVAPALTMFFLTTYGVVNLVAGVERLAGDPSFRPTWNVPWWASMAGALGCFWVMYLINPGALFVALAVEVGVYLAMRRRALVAPWGDLRRGALTSLVRSSVLQLRRLPKDPRNWRPNILLFAGSMSKRPELVRYANWLVQDRGILTVADLKVGAIDELGPEVEQRSAELNAQIDEVGVQAFGEVSVVDDFVHGAITIAQANGIAGIETNTAMFGWSDKHERRASALTIIEALSNVGISSVICRPRPLQPLQGRREIHIWWGGLQQNGDMLVLFAHLLSLNPQWRNANISIKSVATSEMMLRRNEGLLDEVIKNARISAAAQVMLKPADRSVQEVMAEQSASADVVFMGLRSVAPGTEAEYADRIEGLLCRLPTVMLIRSAGEFRGRLLGDHAVETVATPGVSKPADADGAT
ncbi:MAG: Na-K-Cl cotransporter [Acidimicrobiia bacterium]|nr:Na-K-Cl cotransporter [Acidimicrobiia bacterium]